MDYLTVFLSKAYNSSVKVITSAGNTIKYASNQYLVPFASKMATSASEKAKEIYSNHKEIIISTTVALTVYLIMRKRDEKKPEK
jgi:hypothetical protein